MVLEIGFLLPVTCCTLSLSFSQNTVLPTTAEIIGNRKTNTHLQIPSNLLVGNKNILIRIPLNPYIKTMVCLKEDEILVNLDKP